jgi:hypothetical protein
MTCGAASGLCCRRGRGTSTACARWDGVRIGPPAPHSPPTPPPSPPRRPRQTPTPTPHSLPPTPTPPPPPKPPPHAPPPPARPPRAAPARNLNEPPLSEPVLFPLSLSDRNHSYHTGPLPLGSVRIHQSPGKQTGSKASSSPGSVPACARFTRVVSNKALHGFCLCEQALNRHDKWSG